MLDDPVFDKLLPLHPRVARQFYVHRPQLDSNFAVIRGDNEIGILPCCNGAIRELRIVQSEKKKPVGFDGLLLVQRSKTQLDNRMKVFESRVARTITKHEIVLWIM